MSMPHRYHIFDTAGGWCGIAWNEVGIARFQLPASNANATERNLLRHLPGAVPSTPSEAVLTAVDAVKRYFAGEKVDFSDLNLDLNEQDSFFKQVYAAARRVRWGQTTTYGALAKELGAMAKNPVALIIPCHRVLAAGGKVGGFSAPGGSASKIRMLELEGVQVGPAPAAQQALKF